VLRLPNGATSLTKIRANIARAGHSVLLLEAGGDNGDDILQQMPFWASANAEMPDVLWAFFVGHYQNETQARRDSKFSYLMPNGSYYTGLDPPANAEP